MKSFLLALQFLTIIPVRIDRPAAKEFGRAIACFPIVGLLLGSVLVAANHLLLLARLDPLASNAILIVLLVVLTGGLHLDGLSDTADALFSGKDRARMLEIMRDPHVGAMGVLAIVSVLMLKVSFLSAVSTPFKDASLVLMCVVSRWSMVLSMFVFPYARTEGKAKVFIDEVLSVAKVTGLAVFAIAALFTCVAGLRIKIKIGGITGDTIGAVSELTEVMILLNIIILERIFI
jgi:adenosylcobinamide-GDP ribazoletransferase